MLYSAYYKNISGKAWGERHNYDLMIDSSIGIDHCVDAIFEYLAKADVK